MFDLGAFYQSADGTNTRQWDIDPKEERFLTLKPGDAAAADAGDTKPQIVVVRNWFEELKRVVPAK